MNEESVANSSVDSPSPSSGPGLKRCFIQLHQSRNPLTSDSPFPVIGLLIQLNITDLRAHPLSLPIVKTAQTQAGIATLSERRIASVTILMEPTTSNQVGQPAGDQRQSPPDDGIVRKLKHS